MLSYALFEGRPVTTKGRWINPLIFTLFALKKRLPPLKKVEQPIFIVGTGRSGTTILGIVLSLHQDVGFLNEPKALWHAIYPHEDLIGSYSCEAAHYRLSAKDVTDEVTQSAHRLFGAYLTAVASKRVVDKYPELIFRTSFVRTIFPDAKFIFLVRNGWDTCQSITGWSKRFGVQDKDEVHDWWGVNYRKWHLLVNQLVATNPNFKSITEEVRSLNRQTDMAAVEWIVTMKEGLRLMQESDSIYKLHYEELTSHPDKSLTQLLEFCELPTDKAVFDYAHQILAPAPPHKSFDLHPAIRPLFEDTMTALGYEI
ncbi:MAG: sulfotransferase [Microcoleus sp. SIO2G3]|nr:sulfotransferase [Microcoleus sp. SIO2G3]